MSLLLISEIRDNVAPPAFGGDFAAHIARKTNPAVRAASLTAWNLLAQGLWRIGGGVLPDVAFTPSGKPEFIHSQIHFSLAHGGNLAAALLSDAPCGVDVERIRPETAERLRARCLSAEELRLGLDFFECWTKKECIGKLDGTGIDAHPARIDTLDTRWEGRFLARKIRDSSDREYALAALCRDAQALSVEWMEL